MNGEAKKRAIADRLETLATGGRLTPDQVVEDAADPGSPLHGEFLWDNDEAAQRYRLDQARHLISSYRVIIERRSFTISAPAYVRDPSAEQNEQGYRSVASLKSDKDMAREALVSEAGRAAAYLDRVRNLAVALGMEREINGILEQFAAFRSMVQQERRAA